MAYILGLYASYVTLDMYAIILDLQDIFRHGLITLEKIILILDIHQL